MISPLLKSLPITARKGQPIRGAEPCQYATEKLAEDRYAVASTRWKVQRWWRQLRLIGAGCLAVGVFFSHVGLSAGYAQQTRQAMPGVGAARNVAPPVHISPGSATALPPNRHRPKATPGFERVQMPHQRESIGIQDRLVQRLSSRTQAGSPTPARQLPAVVGQGQIVGSGLRRVPSKRSHEINYQEPFDHVVAGQDFEGPDYSQPHYSQHNPLDYGQRDYRQQDDSQNFDNPTPRSVVEAEQFEVDLPSVPRLPNDSQNAGSVRSPVPHNSVRPATAQDGEAAPVRHAFVQEQYLRNQVREGVQFDDSSMNEPFDDSLEWSDETAISSQPQPTRGRVPARSTSILSRQDEDQDNREFRPQPAPEQDRQPSEGFQDEMDRLDRQFEGRKLGSAQDPEALPEADRPRSLLNLEDDADDEDSDDELDDDDEDAKTTPLDRTCDDFRASLLNTSIRDIALDISPPAINTDQNYMGISRSWTDRHGQIISTGTMVDLRRGYVFLDNGQKIAFARLSEPDIAAVSEHWNIPRSCLVSSVGTVERCWQPQSYQWTASSLCHKPLYFENIQLERYGHSHGPIMQPVRSVAHFFVSLATLPYHTAIHPPNECEYALGLYRPGDCAPWLKDPIPISLDGMRRQALVTTGLAFIP